MKNLKQFLVMLVITAAPIFGDTVKVGIGRADITPHIGTPSAGYTDRKGEGMKGVHDPLLALALYIDNGEKKVVLCSVDHLGYTFDMVQAITKRVQTNPSLSKCDVYIASSHTHSGGGAYLNIPFLGESLAGPYSAEITEYYIEKTAQAIFEAASHPVGGLIGIGYGHIQELSKYRGLWPKDIDPLSDVAVIKVTKLDGSPFAVIFNYPLHPTVLKSENRQFSSDFVGYVRTHIQSLLGKDIQPIYFNGAQGEILPDVANERDSFVVCEDIGRQLAEKVHRIWEATNTNDSVHIKTQKHLYSFQPQATPFGLTLPIKNYQSEINALIFNHIDAFITIPGELSCIYDQKLKDFGRNLGFNHVSIFGLTNDAHGYMILPESWQHKTMESGLSLGGENYGEFIESTAKNLLENNAP